MSQESSRKLDFLVCLPIISHSWHSRWRAFGKVEQAVRRTAADDCLMFDRRDKINWRSDGRRHSICCLLQGTKSACRICWPNVLSAWRSRSHQTKASCQTGQDLRKVKVSSLLAWSSVYDVISPIKDRNQGLYWRRGVYHRNSQTFVGQSGVYVTYRGGKGHRPYRTHAIIRLGWGDNSVNSIVLVIRDGVMVDR